jgi:prevent-host-death family protein
MTRILPISEVKTRLPELVTGVEGRGEQIVVTRKGKPVAVLVLTVYATMSTRPVSARPSRRNRDSSSE